MSKAKLSENDFVTMTNISNYCMVSPSTVRRWIKGRKLHAFRLPSGHYRVTVRDLRDFRKRYDMPPENW